MSPWNPDPQPDKTHTMTLRSTIRNITDDNQNELKSGNQNQSEYRLRNRSRSRERNQKTLMKKLNI